MGFVCSSVGRVIVSTVLIHVMSHVGYGSEEKQ